MSGSPRPPASFLPLDDHNAVPGDAGELSALSRRYADTAAEIEAQAAHLERLTSRSQEAWKSEAGENFVEVAGDLAQRILRARGRYEAASQALEQFASDLEVVQTAAYAAVRRAQEAEASRRALETSAPASPGVGATPEQLLIAGEEQRRHDRAVNSAATDLGAARRDYENAVGEYHRAAERAARTLGAGRGDELVDDWWDENAWWIDTVLDAISVVVLVLTVVAIVLIVIGTAGAAGLMLAGAALTAVAFGGRLALWRTDNGSFEDVLWEAAGLLTFGLGKLVSAVARPALRATSQVGGRVGTARAGRQAFTDAGRSPLLFSVGRLPLVRPVLEFSPRLRTTFAAADEAGQKVLDDIGKAAGTPSSRFTRGLAFGEEPIAQFLSALPRIHGAAKGGAQMKALVALGDAVVLGSVTAPNVVITGNSVVGAWENYVSNAEAESGAQRAEIVDRWSMQLSRVP